MTADAMHSFNECAPFNAPEGRAGFVSLHCISIILNVRAWIIISCEPAIRLAKDQHETKNRQVK